MARGKKSTDKPSKANDTGDNISDWYVSSLPLFAMLKLGKLGMKEVRQ